ncbi:hypothetical protein QUF95_11995 [Paenibacillus silvae]|uniref:hypothetical protein n=1 Tax=Paenibacillus silvae TaxID=1325358 RepID=UPI0025A0DFA2|nr:hypothetical protein [Paenibacillus silvae]MDM5278112.1 hypothetical protein [Paenibacillus silvae]
MLDVGAEHPFRSRIVLSIAVVSPFLKLPFKRLKWKDKGERFASSESISFPPLRLHQHSNFNGGFMRSKRQEPENLPAGFYFYI